VTKRTTADTTLLPPSYTLLLSPPGACRFLEVAGKETLWFLAARGAATVAVPSSSSLLIRSTSSTTWGAVPVGTRGLPGARWQQKRARQRQVGVGGVFHLVKMMSMIGLLIDLTDYDSRC